VGAKEKQVSGYAAESPKGGRGFSNPKGEDGANQNGEARRIVHFNRVATASQKKKRVKSVHE